MLCVYCESPAIKDRIVTQDNLVMVFPTNIPIVPGHMLICPVRHVATFEALSDQELIAIRTMVARIKEALKSAFGTMGYNHAFNEGVFAGQSVPHFHLHLLPRKFGDDGVYSYEPRQFLYRPGSRATTPEEELQKVAQLIRQHL